MGGETNLIQIGGDEDKMCSYEGGGRLNCQPHLGVVL